MIACFDDTGLDAARSLATGPVVGIGEAAFHCASLIAGRFSVITTLSRSVPAIEHNLGAATVSPHAAPACGRPRFRCLALEDATSDARARISTEIEAAKREDRCEAIVLGCAGMADLAAVLSAAHAVAGDRWRRVCRKTRRSPRRTGPHEHPRSEDMPLPCPSIMAAGSPPMGSDGSTQAFLIHRELRRPGVTLMLLWEEYCDSTPEAFSYSWFCEHYKDWAGRLKPTLRQVHVAGGRLDRDVLQTDIEHEVHVRRSRSRELVPACRAIPVCRIAVVTQHLQGQRIDRALRQGRPGRVAGAEEQAIVEFARSWVASPRQKLRLSPSRSGRLRCLRYKAGGCSRLVPKECEGVPGNRDTCVCWAIHSPPTACRPSTTVARPGRSNALPLSV